MAAARETFDDHRANQSMLRLICAERRTCAATAGHTAVWLRRIPGSADAETRLEDDLRYDRGPERAAAQKTVERDSARFSPQMRAENDEAAGYIADTIARTGFTVNGPGAMADEAIGRIAEIRRLGTTMEPAVVDGRSVVGDFQDAIVVDGVWRNPQTLEPLAIKVHSGLKYSKDQILLIPVKF